MPITNWSFERTKMTLSYSTKLIFRILGIILLSLCRGDIHDQYETNLIKIGTLDLDLWIVKVFSIFLKKSDATSVSDVCERCAQFVVVTFVCCWKKNNNKTGLQPVSRPVEKFLVFSYSLQKLPKSVVTMKVKLGNRKRKGANSLQMWTVGFWRALW